MPEGLYVAVDIKGAVGALARRESASVCGGHGGWALARCTCGAGEGDASVHDLWRVVRGAVQGSTRV